MSIDCRCNNKVDLSSAPWKMHEFFAGSGLVAYGLKGIFSPVWANDISKQKADVYRANFDCSYFVLKDIKNIKGTDLPFAHLSWASFPCQDLSLAGSIGGINASRSGLIWEWLRILDEMEYKPRLLLLENVVGLLSTHGGKNYKILHEALVGRGYRCGAIVVNAAHFLPQSRARVFVIAVHKDIQIPNEINGHGPCWLHDKSAIRLGTELPMWVWWTTDEPPEKNITLENIVERNIKFDRNDILNLIPERHKVKLNSYENIIATGYRRMRNGLQQLELRFDGIAGCLRTPSGGSSRQYIIIKDKSGIHARLLTVREAARLMGAPDNFLLPGSYNDGYKAMGDAVAMPVAKFIGERFLVKLAEVAYHD